jgi:hypothetical protein
MKSPKGCLLILTGLVVASLAFTAVSYYGSYFFDLYQRPWAYTADPAKPLLVGKWAGQFRDPDGVQKSLTVEILVPVTDEERLEKAGRRRRRSRTNKKTFDGFATVSSKRGAEQYELWGSVKEREGRTFAFSMRPVDEKKMPLPNFQVLEANAGSWENNTMTITVSFSYRKADGAGFWSSADPRFEKTAEVKLVRF